MIKNIIFDLGNVIISFDKDKIISKFTKEEEEIDFVKENIFNSPEWQQLDLGVITNEEAIVKIQKRNNIKYKNLIKRFLSGWYKDRMINGDIVEIAKELKENGYNIYVLSNMAYKTYECLKHEEFFKLCDGVVISANEHIKKPDERIFRILLERYNLNPEECLFIDDDDTNRSYITANSLGILGRRVKPNSKEDIMKLLDEFDIK